MDSAPKLITIVETQGDTRRETTYQIVKELQRSAITTVTLVHDGSRSDGDDGDLFVMKVYGHDGESPDRHDFAFAADKEADALQRVAHEDSNDRVFPRCTKRGSVGSKPAILLRHLDGTPLRDWIEQPREAFEIETLLVTIAEALDACAAAKVIHADVSDANVLVMPGGRAALIDFNIAKFAKGRQTTTTSLKLPTDLPGWSALRKQEPWQEEVINEGIPAIDAHGFGLLLEGLLKTPRFRASLTAETRHHLQTLVGETKSWLQLQYWEPGTLASRVSGTLYGSSPLELRDATAQLDSINISSMPVPLTSNLEGVLDSTIFARMRELRQLSLVRHVHAGAEHTRWEHLVHTYELARQYARSLTHTPLFRTYMDVSSQRQMLGTALMHDLNHFPFMHYLQEHLPESVEDEWVLEVLFDAAGKDSIAALNGFDLDIPTLNKLAYSSIGTQDTPQHQLISSLVNSAMDVDKLSYLKLDCQHTGVRFGLGVEIDTLIRLATAEWAPNGYLHMVYAERAIPNVEVMLAARSGMFQSVYWHRINRAIATMICRDFANLLSLETTSGNLVERYLRETLQGGEPFALSWLNQETLKSLERESLSARLMIDRKAIYGRALTVKAERSDADAQIVATIERALSGKRGGEALHAESRLLAPSVQLLEDVTKLEIDEDEVLIDLPKRDLDAETRQEGLYLKRGSSVVNYLDVTGQAEYTGSKALQRLRRHVRVFVAPRVWETLKTSWNPRVHSDLLSALLEGAQTTAGRGLR